MVTLLIARGCLEDEGLPWGWIEMQCLMQGGFIQMNNSPGPLQQTSTPNPFSLNPQAAARSQPAGASHRLWRNPM